MDNFLDKLAERYNAQDMIRANSQAESTQLKSLEDQVEAYETVLQEMRKLNYKNSELTEKMYALVDESLEKVRNLSIEASEGTASAETISREMNDAVSRAVSEAMGSMDEGVARKVAETLENALLQPTTDTMRTATDELKVEIAGITAHLEESANDRVEIMQALASIQERLEQVRSTPSEEGTASVDLEPIRSEIAGNSEEFEAVKSGISSTQQTLTSIQETLSSSHDERKEILDAVRLLADERGSFEEALSDTGKEISDRFFAIQQSNTNIEESISTFSTAVQTIVENHQDSDVEIEQHIERIESAINDLKESTRGMDPEMGDRLAQIESAISALTENTRGIDPEMNERLGQIISSIEALQQPTNLEDLTQESLSALAQTSAQTQDNVTALKASIDDVKNTVDTAVSGVGELRAQQDALSQAQAEIAQQQAAIAEQQNAMALKQNAIAQQQAAMAQRQNEMSELQTAMAQSQAEGGGDDLRSTLMDLTTSKTEILTHLRNLKSSTDEGKTTYKSALDTAIYGLKQDNKELIEFLNRINATVEHLSNDPERAQREAEEQARAEQERQALEERFKLAEDFMHKESVKVYRNVQAVINEKEDKRREGVDGGLENVDRSVRRVKAVAVLSLIVGLINLAITVLSFFHLL